MVIEAFGGGKGNAPIGFKLRPNVCVVHLLIAGEHVWHRAKVAGALHIVVATERIGPSSGSHVVARDQQ